MVCYEARMGDTVCVAAEAYLVLVLWIIFLLQFSPRQCFLLSSEGFIWKDPMRP